MLQSAVVPMIRSWVTVDAEALTIVAQACRDHERLRFDYRTFEGAETERHVEPHQLVSLHQRWYLLAWDRDREGWRTFRLDRLSSPRGTRIGFKARPIPGGDAAEYVVSSLRTRPMRYQVLATLDAPALEISAKLRFGEAEIEKISETQCQMKMQGDALEWLAFTLIWLDVDFIVHEPPELIDYLRGVSQRLESRSA
jgi:predicted DNA-binding transcriptional regulator YafY